MHETKLNVRSRHGYDLSVVITYPASPKRFPAGVLLAHGFGSGKDNRLNNALVPILTGSNVPTCRFDFAGHGKSGGKTDNLTIATAADDIVTVLAVFRREALSWRGKVGVVASSFGASAALRVLKKMPGLRAVFFRAPISDYAEVRRIQFGDDGMRKWKQTGTADVDSSKGPIKSGYEFYKDALAHDTYKEVRRFGIPTLVVQGDADDNVPLSQSEKLVEALGQKASLVVIPGADHGFSKGPDFDRLVDLCVKFLKSKLLNA